MISPKGQDRWTRGNTMRSWLGACLVHGTRAVRKTLLPAALATAGMLGHANAVIISDNTVSGTTTNTFDALPDGNVPAFISQTGATYGEGFAGQTLSTAGGFDSFLGLPTAPLTLLANPVLGDNIGILTVASPVIYGDLGFAIGEGAVSILFAAPTGILGFDVVGTDGGNFTVEFFGSDGSLLGAITQLATDSFFGFSGTAGELIAGVSITNTDPAGIGFDNVTFNGTSIPEPASLWLLGAGLVIVSARARQRRANRKTLASAS